ncbi:MAG: glycoside hydrolase family protein [Bacteroidota bacterium]
MKYLKSKIGFAIVIYVSTLSTLSSQAQTPYEPKEIIYGGQFKDLILPIPIIGKLTAEGIWGTEVVLPRDVSNGVEGKEWSYWGGNPMLGKDDKYHIAIARWPEEKGHWGWPKSEVAHAVSENPLGPYEVTGTLLSEAHNPEVIPLEDGTYALHVSKGFIYTSEKLTGPWELKGKIEIDQRGHKGLSHLYTNLTGVQREDGSFLFFTKRGDVMISNTGLLGPYKIVSSRNYDRYSGYPEDPVIWKSCHQYHVVFNHAVDKKSVYMRSLDGIHWKIEAGKPYDKSIFKYTDGTSNEWCKFERPKVIQDEYGRATHLSLAVIDVEKKLDLGNDKHNSKQVILPLVTERLVEIVATEKITPQTKKVKIKIKAETGNEVEDIDIESLRLGASEVVNHGGGVKAIASKVVNGDLELIFKWDGSQISNSNYDLKVLGKTKTGSLVLGYALLPEFSDNPAALVTLPIKIKDKVLITEVENFGLKASTPSTLTLFRYSNQEREQVKQFSIPSLKPYERFAINFDVEKKEGIKYEALITHNDEAVSLWNKVDDTHYSIVYRGDWQRNVEGQNLYMGSEQVTSNEGAAAIFFFFGTQARCYGNISKKMGSFEVYLDDVFIENIDCYFGADLHNTVIYQTDVIPVGLHKLELRARAKHYKGKPEGPVSIDAFSFIR